MYTNKKTRNLPEQITGVIESIEKSDIKKAEYLGNSDYYVVSFKIEGNDKTFEYSIPEKEVFEFKVGEEVFFRSTEIQDRNKVSHKSFGRKFNVDSEFELSPELLAKLKDRNEIIDNRKTNKFKP